LTKLCTFECNCITILMRYVMFGGIPTKIYMNCKTQISCLQKVRDKLNVHLLSISSDILDTDSANLLVCYIDIFERVKI